MAVLTRDEILQVSDIKIELVPVPEWGGEVYVKGMTGIERAKFERGVFTMRGQDQILNIDRLREKLAVLTVCDEGGKSLFTDEDMRALGQKSAAALQRIFTAAQRLSGLTQEDVQSLTEGLKEDPFDSSASASQDT